MLFKPSPKTVFNTLEQKKHFINETEKYSLFPNPATNIDTEYWLFSDLYNLYKTPYLYYSEETPNQIWHAINSISKANNSNKTFSLYQDHIISIYHDYKIKDYQGTKNILNGQDFKLSRFACWALLHEWDNLIFSQLYFLQPDKKYEALAKQAKYFLRISLRKNLAKQEKIVNAIAYRNHADMRHFNNSLHKAYFYSWDTDVIKSNMGIPIKENDPIANYMTAYSLHKKTIALRNAISKNDTNPHISFETFQQILIEELYKARKNIILTTNKSPEQLISKNHITKVKSELKKIEKDFFNKAQEMKIKTK